MKKKSILPLALLVILAGSLFTWSFYFIIRQALEDGLSLLGVSGFYTINGLILLFTILILVYVGRKKDFLKYLK